MTRLFTCGFETGDINEAGITTVAANIAITAVSTGPTPRAGSYCMRVGPSSGNPTFTQSYKTFALPSAKTEIWLRFAFISHGVAVSANPRILETNDATGNSQIYLEYNATDGLLRLYRTTGNALLGTSSTAFAQDQWHVIEMRHQILSTSTGVAEVWLDGNRVINFSGDVCSTTTANVQTFVLGITTGASTHPVGTYLAFDDIVVNDTSGTLNNGRAGDGRVLLLLPSAAGSSTQFTRGGTDTGANYSQVNELPPSMAQYVGSNTVGNRDLYALADVPVAVSAINVVEALLLVQNSDAGGGSIAPTIKSSATINEVTPIGLSTNPGYVVGRWETDPNTTAAWTIAAVNAAEVGATVR